MRGRVPYRAAVPRLPGEVDVVLADTCRAAVSGVDRAWAQLDRSELVSSRRDGADGTPTFRVDEVVEDAIVDAAQQHGVNILSEELGFRDAGSAVTLVVDPLDGSANAAAGVPLSCFSAALVVDGEPVEALSCWLEQGHTLWARAGEPVGFRTSGTTRLDGAAVDLLRPKRHAGGDSTDAWLRVAGRAGRIRVLSTTCLEAMLVAEGAIDAFADPGSDTHRIVDLAAAMLLVPAAGGAVVDAYGRPVEIDLDLTRRWSGIVAASPALAEQLADVVAQAPLAGGGLPADG
ncbi:inositol monophosphatase family protein [Aeromicrobium sp. CTD01-1L150]|uniref:inositol monophosphatase family protein n=1 Tax=Aeromicrobium sp. CTD01-1L150 TaxID=3341830 RepID=UPI0035BEBD88